MENPTCKRCFVPPTFPGLTVNSDGICNFCEHLSSPKVQDELKNALGIDRIAELKKIAAHIKQEAIEKKTKYDCIIGASGGFDSTYVLYIAKAILGLNPLVVKYDNGVCHEQANNNLKEACRILGVDLRIQQVLPHERDYFLNATKALMNLGVFFSACFSCHYIIAAVAYREARKENLKYMLTSTNQVEKNLAMASHGFMLKSLIVRFFKCGPAKMLKVIYYKMLAHWHFMLLKFSFDGFSLRFFRNLFKLHPATPSFIEKIDVSHYTAWHWPRVEKTLREELHWDTPRRTKVPYFRFDCHYSAMIDKSFKKVTGVSEHGLLINWFAQAGFVSKQEIEDDFNYMNSDDRINKEIEKVFEIFDLPKDRMKDIL